MRGADLRKPLALLLLRAEQQQRLRHADRLVRRQQRRNAGVAGPGQHHRAVVVDLREPEAAVLFGHLHAQGANRLQPGDDLVGDPAVALDLLRIDLVLQERAESRQEPFALLDGVRRQIRLRGDQLGLEVAEVEPFAEARQLPLLLAGALRDRSSLCVAGISCHASPSFRHRCYGWSPESSPGVQAAHHGARAHIRKNPDAGVENYGADGRRHVIARRPAARRRGRRAF